MTERGPDQLQADIERQRAQLADTVDALSAKLDVKAQASAKAHATVAEVKGRVTTADGRPRPELIAAGAALLAVTVVLVYWRLR